ncbi:MAG TPA: hypothetical protein VFO10_07540 [Oligoflexus sp.]|uniref:hypothetical protein n=1 Tax=Oligoflexus sp. TaxID=1971216 RepID=UPI002D7F176D|nr:hypothetical protein [Oligoflexus sp.]HET9237086.1 hypothetical protein [Oligoflexus sp.]
MKSVFLVSLSLMAFGQVFAGGNIGGGTPPAMQDALAQLMSVDLGSGGLFVEKDKLGLAVKGKLNPELTVYKARFMPQSIRMSEEDFSTLSLKKGDIDAVNVEGVNRSYKVEDGEALDTLTLKDRRELMREAAGKSSLD